jgi:ATP-binding cassette, subfamily F, member 3
MIQLKNIQLIRHTKILLDKVNVRIFPQQKVAIVGNNGSGKSSLLALIQQEVTPDQGSVSYPKDWRVTAIAQEISPTDQLKTAIDYVIDGDILFRQTEQALASAHQAQDPLKIATLHEKMYQIDGYRMQAQAGTLLHGLGFSSPQQQQTVGSFSGGWQMRLNLARALLCPSDLLLLDEPTNHLDLDTLIWLEQWLHNYKGTLLLVSHDRDFLDQVVQQTLHIENQSLTLYQGNYSRFEQERAQIRAQQVAQINKQAAQKAHIQKFIDQFRAKASKAKQVQSRLKALDRIEAIADLSTTTQYNIVFLPPKSLPNPLINLDKVYAGYDEKIVLKDVQLHIGNTARIGLLGRNGAGKSTLIKLLTGALQPQSGTVTRHPQINIGYFAQHQLNLLTDKCTPYSYLSTSTPEHSEAERRRFLGQYGFAGDDVHQPLTSFSGGEKARLVLAGLVAQKPNLLILDEPTNHLDIEIRQALTLGLQSYQGALIIVSHDRYLLQATCDELFLVHQHQVTPFQEDLAGYQRWLLHQNSLSDKTTASKNKQPSNKKHSQQRRQLLAPLTKQSAKLEKEISQLTELLATHEAKMSEPTFYTSQTSVEIKDFLQQHQQTQIRLETVESEWLAVQQAIDEL